MNAILIAFHCRSNAGYAMNALLPVFINMARQLVSSEDNIHVSFAELNGFTGGNATANCKNLIEFNPSSGNKSKLEFIENYVRQHNIDVVFGFDQPVSQTSFKYLRKGGVKKIISYWGAPMSSINTGLKLKLKQLEVLLKSNAPDHYIFESREMARSATHGRGIANKHVSVNYLGVDINKFKPTAHNAYYAHDIFNIPRDKKIIYYSGHMEKRKGVAVLIDAAHYLYNKLLSREYHFLILGNQKGQEVPFLRRIKTPAVREYITFGGYRDDVDQIIPCCYLGTIASTGWDSFTMSSLEMSACGLPLIVSNIQGLAETVDDGETGFLFNVGDHAELAKYIDLLIKTPELREKMSIKSRSRIESKFTRELQVARLVNTIKAITGN